MPDRDITWQAKIVVASLKLDLIVGLDSGTYRPSCVFWVYHTLIAFLDNSHGVVKYPFDLIMLLIQAVLPLRTAVGSKSWRLDTITRLGSNTRRRSLTQPQFVYGFLIRSIIIWLLSAVYTHDIWVFCDRKLTWKVTIGV